MTEEIEKEEKWWEEEEEKEEEKIKNLEEQLRPEDREIVILNVVSRTSYGHYNYRSEVYAIFRDPGIISYEDTYVINIRTEEVYCGVYQEYSCYDIDKILEKLENEFGYIVKTIF